MNYISTVFSVDSSSRFSFSETGKTHTDTQTRRRSWKPDRRHGAGQWRLCLRHRRRVIIDSFISWSPGSQGSRRETPSVHPSGVEDDGGTEETEEWRQRAAVRHRCRALRRARAAVRRWTGHESMLASAVKLHRRRDHCRRVFADA